MHQSQNNKFDQQVKKTLEHASVEPPAFLWNAIEGKLPANNTWYSKYKYLLLFLLLAFTSASSIFIYKNLVLKNDVSPIALNKRLFKDETGYAGRTTNESTLSGNEEASKKISENINTSSEKEKNQEPAVASFYSTPKNGATSSGINNSTDAAANRSARLKRLEVKNGNKDSGIKNQDIKNNNVFAATSLSTSKKSTKKSFKNVTAINPNTSDGNDAFADGNTDKISTPNNNTDNNSVAGDLIINSAGSQFSNSVIESEDDVTKPIADRIRGAAEEPLTASVVPVKVQQSPIPSRDVLRSMIEQEKLEKLDIESQAAGITDLNPNKEKMLKNLKQFAGYDINKGFHIGAFISINNVWLNKKQYSADENTTSIKPKVQFGKAYGLNIGYDYTDRWGIELEWQISEQGAKYSMTELNESKKCIKDVNLLYTKFPLMLKYKQMFINNYNSKPIALSFLFGPQVSFLLKKDVQMDGHTLNNVPQYNKAEFGITGGFDFDLFMTRNLALTIGGRTGFGTSMRKGDPMSFQLGVTTQLNFRFPKKIK